MTDAVVVVASGPSLTDAQCQMVIAARERKALHVIVVNDNWRKVPNADVLYAADLKWWDKYAAEVASGFTGECWTRNPEAARKYGLCFIASTGRLGGLSRISAIIHEGGNSGYQAIGLARHFLMRAPVDPDRLIALVGFDMMREGDRMHGRLHWFGDHPRGLVNTANPKQWAVNFVQLAADLKAEGTRIVNCSLATALPLPRADLAETLGAL